MGEVTNVVLFDKETDGVASVRYGNAVAANECVKVSWPLLVLLSSDREYRLHSASKLP